MKRLPQQHPNSDVRRERDRRAFTRQALLLSACVLLALGFIFAAQQKIAAVQYGYRSEELRRERQRLIEEQQRLLLTIEESASPGSLEHAARGLGMQPARASQIGRGDRQTDEARAEREVDDANADLRKKGTTARSSRGSSEAARVAKPESDVTRRR
jgi:hypothetical protein